MKVSWLAYEPFSWPVYHGYCHLKSNWSDFHMTSFWQLQRNSLQLFTLLENWACVILWLWWRVGWIHTTIFSFWWRGGGSHNELDSNIILSEFELQSRYFIHFQTNTFSERHEPSSPTSYRLNSITTIDSALNNPQRLTCHKTKKTKLVGDFLWRKSFFFRFYIYFSVSVYFQHSIFF